MAANQNSMDLCREKATELLDCYITQGEWRYPTKTARDKVLMDRGLLKSRAHDLLVLTEKVIKESSPDEITFSDREELREIQAIARYTRRGRKDRSGKGFRWTTVSGGLPGLGRR